MHCCVRGCISKKQNASGINFFRFPTKPQQKEHWLKALNIQLLESQKTYVCSKHFEQKYFKIRNGKCILLPGAIPTTTKLNITNTTKKLIPIQPKKPCSIVVVPIHQTKNQIEIETVEVEIDNFEDNQNQDDSSATESVISLNSDCDNETTQTLDESCYILVEVNDKKDDTLNPQDDANIVASGFNIKELIDDAKIAINNKKVQTPIVTKRKKWRPTYIGDCVYEDMEDPVIRKHHWNLALNEIKKLRSKVTNLAQKSRRLEKRLESANLLIAQLKENK